MHYQRIVNVTKQMCYYIPSKLIWSNSWTV